MCDDSIKINLRCLKQFIVSQVRKWKLVGNERTTLLSHGEELQMVQYCLAVHNKETNGLFHADPKQCCHLLAAIRRHKTRLLEKLIERQLQNKEQLMKSDEPTENLDCPERNSNHKDLGRDSVAEGEGSRGLTYDAQEQNNLSIVEGHVEGVEGEVSLAKSLTGELELESGLVDSILNILQENLKSGNHLTMLDIYETFVKELLKEDSKLLDVKSQVNKEMKLSEDNDTSAIEYQIFRLLKGANGTSLPQQGTVGTAVQFENHCPDSVVASTPKTGRLSKTLECINNCSPKTPQETWESSPTLTPKSSFLPCTPLNAGQRLKVQKKFIENIFLCYLHLLVNARCELALATIFNIPDRELSHEAFTHLKHLATNSKLSMYQTLSTFLMRIRLGGQGYAPSTDQPLFAYIKGLGNLFDFLDKMQTVVEENPQPRSACRRLLNILKSSLSSCRSGKFPRGVVETVAENILNTFSNLLENQEGQGEDTDRTVSSGGSMSGQRSLSVIRQYLDISATASSPVDHFMLFDVRFSQDTPTRFPSLLSKFRSPMPIEEESQDQKEKVESQEDAPVNKTNQVLRFKTSEALYLDGSNEDDIICTPFESESLTIMPSKTIVHPGSFSRELILQQNLDLPSAVTGASDKTSKRSNGNCLKPKIGPKRGKKAVQPVEGQENTTTTDTSPQPKKASLEGKSKKCLDPAKRENANANGTKTKGKSCRRKLMVQVKGQSKITGFFKA